MNYIETKDLTKQYLLARIPFIAINSIEKKRVERMFLELSKEMNIPIYFYSMSKGLFEITSGKVLNETKTTTGVLDYIGEQLKLKDNHIFGEYCIEDILMLYALLIDKFILSEENLITFLSPLLDVERDKSILNEFKKFNKLNTFDDFLPMLKNHPYYGTKAGRDMYFALTYYILSNYRKSSYFLDKIIALKNKDNHVLFSQEIENSKFMKDCIESGNYDKGISQILQWQEQTIKAIGLTIK